MGEEYVARSHGTLNIQPKSVPKNLPPRLRGSRSCQLPQLGADTLVFGQ